MVDWRDDVTKAGPGEIDVSLFLRRSARTGVAAVAAGAFAGFLAGGVWGRVAMRIIAVTNPSDDGAASGSGAAVGAQTLSGTLNLFGACSVIGIFGGLMYIVLRRWIPVSSEVKGLLFGVGLLALVGFVIINTGDADFIMFEPAWAVVMMFAFIFVLYGAVVGPVASWLAPEPPHIEWESRLKGVSYAIAGLLLLGGGTMLGLSTLEIIEKENTCLAAGPGAVCAERAP